MSTSTVRHWQPPRDAVPLTCALLAGALLACADSAPEAPGWAEVAPILRAQCVRCHGAPAIGGAPTTFRLDRYDDTSTPTGRVLGAAAMAEWIASRTGDGSMPPRGPLADHDVTLLGNWYARRPAPSADGELPPERGIAAVGNRAPTLSLEAIAELPADSLRLAYELRDPDGDLVVGELVGRQAGVARVLGELHAGRGEVVVDTALLAPGELQLWATVDDGAGPLALTTAAVPVAPPRPAPPRLTLAPNSAAALAQGSYLAVAELPFAVELDVYDADSASLQLEVALVDEAAGGAEVQRERRTVASGARVRVALGNGATAPGPGYRVRAVISDGARTYQTESGRFRIANATTTDTFRSIVGAVLGPHCAGCHSAFRRIPGLEIDLSTYADTATSAGAYGLRRRIYQRAVVAATMPPGSARRSGNQLTADERARLAAWLFAGAPP